LNELHMRTRPTFGTFKFKIGTQSGSLRMAGSSKCFIFVHVAALTTLTDVPLFELQKRPTVHVRPGFRVVDDYRKRACAENLREGCGSRRALRFDCKNRFLGKRRLVQTVRRSSSFWIRVRRVRDVSAGSMGEG